MNVIAIVFNERVAVHHVHLLTFCYAATCMQSRIAIAIVMLTIIRTSLLYNASIIVIGITGIAI